jgi:hypothetical protein
MTDNACMQYFKDTLLFCLLGVNNLDQFEITLISFVTNFMLFLSALWHFIKIVFKMFSWKSSVEKRKINIQSKYKAKHLVLNNVYNSFI